MQKARFALIVLLVAAVPVVAVFGAAWVYFRPEPAASSPNPPPPPPKPLPVVLTASRDLAIGSLITTSDVVWAPVKNGTVLSTHMVRGKTKPASVVGAVVRRAVYKGTPLTWSSIVRPGQYGFLAAALRPNQRAVTIMVNRATSQAGLIYPGDRVDVILTVQLKEGNAITGTKTTTFTGTILENIRVVAVNRQVESSIGSQEQTNRRNSRNTASTVTLEVSPLEAERLVLATSQGKISLAMRSLTDGRRRDTRTATVFENLLSLPPTEAGSNAVVAEPEPPAPPPPAAPPEPPAVAPPEPVRVQIFRGGAREEVMLEK